MYIFYDYYNRHQCSDPMVPFIKKTIKGHSLTRITSKEGVAILLSEEDYESLLETAELLSIPGFRESIIQANKEIDKGEVFSFDEAFKE